MIIKIILKIELCIKANAYSYRSIYTNPMVTSKQKFTIDTQKSRKEPKDTIKKSLNYKKTGIEKNYRNNQKTNNYMAISTYLCIITLNVNGLMV